MAEQSRVFTRRDLLRGAGALGAAAALPLTGEAADAGHAAVAGVETMQAGGAVRDPLETLTAAEADTLEAMCARLVPSDRNGPGAKEARVIRYIDRALGGALAGSRDAYRAGLSALDRYARASRGGAFHELNPADQDSVLMDVESGSVTPGIFAASSASFFTMVRSHTMQGMFGDPFYGGNAGFLGWDLIRYPGVRTQVTAADQQQLERNALAPNHRSAYDTEMFHKATVRLETAEGGAHGD
jgi:gluconate 2-dehydrogenase gamma chain